MVTYCAGYGIGHSKGVNVHDAQSNELGTGMGEAVPVHLNWLVENETVIKDDMSYFTLLPMTAPRKTVVSVGWQPKVTFSCQPEAA